MVEAGTLARLVEERYAGWSGELGAAILDGSLSLADLAARVEAGEVDPHPVSGHQELLESIVNRHIWAVDGGAGR